MATSERIFVDQENQAPEGVLAPKRGKLRATEGTIQRAVLGEISQNVRQPPHQLRASKPAAQGAFTIFCDDAAGKKAAAAASAAVVAPSSSFDKENRRQQQLAVIRPAAAATAVPAALPRPAILDKENILPLPAHLPVPKNKKMVAGEGLRAQQTLRTQLNPAIFIEEKMNISLVGDEESPMLVEVEEREQWRVPPIHTNNNLTVDIFSEPEYFQDIYRYLKESELKHMPKWNYMTKQTDINHNMRSILVDWLVEVGEEYKLQTETLFLAVSYIDRFLSYMAVQRSKLQLVGTACMFIAAKYEEIYPPDVSEFVYITDDTYNKRQVLRMEHLVLKVLEFDLSVPTAHLFVSKMCQMIPTEDKVRSLALYLSEMSLVDGENFLRFPPSQVGGAAVALSRHTLGLEAWPELLATQAGYQVEDLKECLVALHVLFSQAETAPQQAVRDKYRATKYHCVSELSPPSLE